MTDNTETSNSLGGITFRQVDLSFKRRLPVHYHRDRCRGTLLKLRRRRDQQKPLPIGRNVGTPGSAGRKKDFGKTHFKLGCGIYFCSHYLSVGRGVEDLLTIAPPHGRATAAGRNLELAGSNREGLHVDFLPPAVIRRVGCVQLAPSVGPVHHAREIQQILVSRPTAAPRSVSRTLHPKPVRTC